MDNNYNNVDFCLDLLYNFIYKKDKKDSYILNYINLNDIKSNDVIKSDDYNYEHIFKNEFKIVDERNDYLLLKRYGRKFNSTLKIGLYNDKIYNDMKFNYIISFSSLSSDLNYQLLPICNFKFKLSNIKNEKLKKILLKKFNKESLIYTQVYEHYYKLTSLETYLKLNYESLTLKQWKVLLFQIIYALHIINIYIPGFKHGNFDYKSIFLYEKKYKFF